MPHVVIIAGPNGAGKSTIAPYLLRDELGVTEFVNADTIAQGLSAFSPEKAAISAGRIMLKRLEELARANADFAYETTLSSKSFFTQLTTLRKGGYTFTLIFLWLGDVELALMRVAERVSQGGHNIPSAIIRRRYEKEAKNFFHLYRQIADKWYFYDNSSTVEPVLIARGRLSKIDEVLRPNCGKTYKRNMKKFKINKKDRIQEILSDEKQVTAILRKAVRAAVLHKQAGNPIATMKNGKAVG